MQTGLSLNDVLAINRTAFEHAFSSRCNTAILLGSTPLTSVVLR